MKKISTKNYVNSMRVHFLPFLVWIGTVAIVVSLFSHRSRRYEILGVAQGPVHQIAATCDGRLVNVSVELFDEVKKGDVLAVLNSVADNENPQELIQAQTATILAEMDRLRAEWEATKEQVSGAAAGAVTDIVARRRNFAIDVEDKRFKVQELETEIRADELMLSSLELDSKIFVLGGRLDTNDVALYELKKLRAEHEAAKERIEDNKSLLELARLDLKQAETRQEEFAKQESHPIPMDAGAVLVKKAIEVQNKRMAELQVQLAALSPVELRAPFDGVVSVVLRNQGEAVLAGEPILTVSKKTPDNIVAYATEEQAGRVREDMKVQLINRNSRPNVLVDSKVVFVGPTVEQMPARMWRNPNMPQWGRPILIAIPSGFKVVPGAMVGIKGI
ncbi:MAG: efflux RND transporter periplasmic adaptor subunit [Sedimentisphaerales bacterium]|nr:efflux RND transporter periplasmic adaptor subunit [Sedimentisphaerales bacterium]